MENKSKETVSVRFDISVQANEKLEMFQASERIKGNKITKEEAADYMILNFKQAK
jgi:hypothetical protein